MLGLSLPEIILVKGHTGPDGGDDTLIKYAILINLGPNRQFYGYHMLVSGKLNLSRIT